MSTHRMLRRTPIVFLVAVAMCMAMVACSSGGKGTTVKDLNALGTKTDDDLKQYLALTEPTKPDAQAWFRFFQKGQKLRVSLRANFDAWSHALDDAIAHGEKPSNASDTQHYRDVLGAWLSDQEEQARLTAACFDGPTPNANTASCFQEMLTKNEARWKTDADTLNKARGKK